MTQQLLQTQYYFHASSEFFFFYHTSIPSDMSKTFPKHSDKRGNIVRCLLDVTVLPEQSVIPLHNTPEAMKEDSRQIHQTLENDLQGQNFLYLEFL